MDNRKAVILLGHGSPVPEANDTLRRVATALLDTGEYALVEPAFLQFEGPGFEAAVDAAISSGFDDIVVMPYFLYSGAHIKNDLPPALESARKRHPNARIEVAQTLGFHSGLVDMARERIREALDGHPSGRPPRHFSFKPHPIEKESFDIIGKELDMTGLDPQRLPVIKRVIHTTADFEFRDLLVFTARAMEAGIGAIKSGADIVTDVRMVEAGIRKDLLSNFNGRVFCFSSDRDVVETARSSGLTKTAASMQKAARFMQGGIAVIGNSPTALMALLRLMESGQARPALVVAVPVGFVGTIEAKEALLSSHVEHISTRGRKGGSTVAAAIVNALIIEALNAGA